MFNINLSKYCLLVAVMATVLLTGCATFGTYETARTASPGKFQVGGAITPMHMYKGEKELSTLFFPLPEFSIKIGVVQNFDIGVRWPLGPGITFTSKYQFLRGPIDGALSLYSSFYSFAFGGVTVGFYQLNSRIILSSEAPNTFPFSVNAGIDYSGVAAGAEGGAASGSILAAVGGIGLPFRLGATRSARIMPELSLTFPIISTFKAGDIGGSQVLIGNFSINFGVGFSYVGPYEK